MKKLMMTVGLILMTQLSYAPGPEVEGQHDVTTDHTEATKKGDTKAVNAEHATDINKKSSTEPTPLPRTNVNIDPLSSSQSVDSVHLSNQSVQPPANVISSGELFTDDSAPTPMVTTIDHPEQSGGWLTPTKKSSTIITDHGDGTHSITNKDEVKGWFTNKTTSTTEKYDTSNVKNQIKNATGKELTGDNITMVKSLIRQGHKINTSEDLTPTAPVTTIDHPVEKGDWFTPTKKSSTTITDHGDGTHSITNKEEVKGWFTNKTTSTTEKYDTSNVKNQIKNATGKELTGDNIAMIKSLIRQGDKINVEEFKTGDKKQTVTDIKGNKVTSWYRTDGTISSIFIKNLDGTSQLTSYNIDGSSIKTTINVDGSSQKVTYDQQGTAVKIENQKAPTTKAQSDKTIIDGVDHSAYGDKSQIQAPYSQPEMPQVILNENNQVIKLKYNDSGKVIEKKNQATKEVEKITYQSDGTSTGITTDAQGVVTKTTSYDKNGQVTTPKLFA